MTKTGMPVGLPCRACRGAQEDTDGNPCGPCGGRGYGTFLRLRHGNSAELTPGTAGWSWTILDRACVPRDGGIAATETDAGIAAGRWAAAEEDRIIEQIAYGILFEAFAQFGVTGTAYAAAYAAVALTGAIGPPPARRTLWVTEHPGGHQSFCAYPSHGLGTSCAASEDDPPTMSGHPSRAWCADHLLAASAGQSDPAAHTQWIYHVKRLRASGKTLDEARAIAGPMPGRHARRQENAAWTGEEG